MSHFCALYCVFYSLQYYVVQPTLEGFKWSVEKTYSDFAQLHKIVSSLMSDVCTLSTCFGSCVSLVVELPLHSSACLLGLVRVVALPLYCLASAQPV